MRIKNSIYKVHVKVLAHIRVTINCSYYSGGHRYLIKSPYVLAILCTLLPFFFSKSISSVLIFQFIFLPNT